MAYAGIPYQGEGRRAVWCPPTATAIDLRRKANVRPFPSLPLLVSWAQRALAHIRADDKVVKDFNIAAGAVLHLVLALRGGSCQVLDVRDLQ